MLVLISVLPTNGPVLTGLKSTYRLGDDVKVNCTSDRSRPSNKLSWYINGEPAPTTALLEPEYQICEDQHEITTLGLSFKLTEHHLKKNEIKIKVSSSAVYFLFFFISYFILQ